MKIKALRVVILPHSFKISEEAEEEMTARAGYHSGDILGTWRL